LHSQPLGGKSRHYPASHRGAKSKRCATSHWAQHQSIAPPAIDSKLKALRHHLVLKFSIVPPLGAYYQHRTTIRCFFQVSCRHWALLPIIVPLRAYFKHHHAFVVRCLK
jgi:hypothetical protein